MKYIDKKAAFSLIEVLISISLFTVFTTSVIFFSMDSTRIHRNITNRLTSINYFREMYNAIFDRKDTKWKNILDITDNSQYHFEFTSNSYNIVNGAYSIDDISMYFKVENAYRDTNNQIVESGGVSDEGTRKITLFAEWTDIYGNVIDYDYSLYVNDWNTYKLHETTYDEFQSGTFLRMHTINNEGGELILDEKEYGNWCAPELTITSYDIPGQGVAKYLYSIPGRSFMVTGGNASGYAFTDANITVDENPILTVNGSFDGGYKANGVFGDDTYAYFTTDTNDREVVILNITTIPYTEVGRFDSSGTTDGINVWVVGNAGFMTAGNVLRSFDLTSKIGSRPQLHSVTLASTAANLFIKGNYAYVVLTGTAPEVQIVDISNPSAMSIVGTIDVDSAGGKAIWVKNGETRAYLATAGSTTKREVFIINVSTKTGSHGAIASMDTNGMNPSSIGGPQEIGRLVVAGTGGSYQYQAFVIENEASPSFCGSLSIPSGITSMVTINDELDNAYSYVLSGDSSTEFKIIRGGSNGGDINGHGYFFSGTYISSVLNTGVPDPYYYNLQLIGTLPSLNVIESQLRAGDSPDLSALPFVGPDGTSNTRYSGFGSFAIPDALQNKQYIQYKLYLFSDTVYTPIVKDVIIKYQE